jgi:short-subunit dehydrogenase
MSSKVRNTINKTALVTGASSGIGLAFARALAADGWSLTLVARREERLKEIANSLPSGPHRYIVADLSTDDGVQAVVADLKKLPPDLLINNAGFVVHGTFHTSPLDKQLEIMRLNMDALVSLSRAFLAHAKSGDALINVASTLAMLPYPTGAVYAATKAFTLSLSEALWFEQKDRGIYVMAICPGPTSTELHSASGGQEPPSSITQTPEEVVAEALKGLGRRKSPTIISGRTNRVMAMITQHLSRKAVVGMMGSTAQKAAGE